MIEAAINLILFIGMGTLIIWGVLKIALEVFNGDV